MDRCQKLLEKAQRNPRGLRFQELERLAECHNFYLDRQQGSHRIYRHDGVRVAVALQPDKNGQAKAYQVKQMLQYIAKTQGE